MDTKIAKVASIAFQPLLIPTYGFIILFNLHAYFAMALNPAAKWSITGIIFTTTFLFPAILIFFLMKMGIVSSLNLRKREERIMPFIITTIFYYLAFHLLKNMPISPIYYYFMIAFLLNSNSGLEMWV